MELERPVAFDDLYAQAASHAMKKLLGKLGIERVFVFMALQDRQADIRGGERFGAVPRTIVRAIALIEQRQARLHLTGGVPASRRISRTELVTMREVFDICF